MNAQKRYESKKNQSNQKKTSNRIVSLNEFLLKIEQLKASDNYKSKGPFIYCAIKRKLNCYDWLSRNLYKINCYHAAIFECTKKLIIHYGEEDENGNKKPLSLESKNENDLSDYYVIKYFYSKEPPEKFINLVDKNDWTSEKFRDFKHNCIHCVNEYLLINNITPIPFGLYQDMAYEYLCNKCIKHLGRYKMYIRSKDINISRSFYDLSLKSGDNFETVLISYDPSDYYEYLIRCERCFDNMSSWKYNASWLQNSEEEEQFFFEEMELDNKIEELIQNFEKVGESLGDALINIKIKGLPKYQYGLVRKNSYDDSNRNFGFAALVSLNENKIIEYGNKDYNDGAPVLREIDFEDKFLYHIVRIFHSDKNINEVFNSINLTPWLKERYDIHLFNSYNFINIYLNKLNQELFLVKKCQSFNSAFMHLCRECYKKLNHPDFYAYSKQAGVHFGSDNIGNEKKDKYWWCWDCGRPMASFHFIGKPSNIIYQYLCRCCYYELAEPKNYIKFNNANNNRMNFRLFPIMNLQNLINRSSQYCNRCSQFNASYKLIQRPEPEKNKLNEEEKSPKKKKIEQFLDKEGDLNIFKEFVIYKNKNNNQAIILEEKKLKLENDVVNSNNISDINNDIEMKEDMNIKQVDNNIENNIISSNEDIKNKKKRYKKKIIKSKKKKEY